MAAEGRGEGGRRWVAEEDGGGASESGTRGGWEGGVWGDSERESLVTVFSAPLYSPQTSKLNGELERIQRHSQRSREWCAAQALSEFPIYAIC